MVMTKVRDVPRVELVREGARGFVVYLQCTCGADVRYPGTSYGEREIECMRCRTIWRETP